MNIKSFIAVHSSLLPRQGWTQHSQWTAWPATQGHHKTLSTAPRPAGGEGCVGSEMWLRAKCWNILPAGACTVRESAGWPGLQSQPGPGRKQEMENIWLMIEDNQRDSLRSLSTQQHPNTTHHILETTVLVSLTPLTYSHITQKWARGLCLLT